MVLLPRTTVQFALYGAEFRSDESQGRVHSPEPQHRSVVNGRCRLTVAATAKLMRQGSAAAQHLHTGGLSGRSLHCCARALTFSIRIFRNHSAHVTTWVPEPAVCRGLVTAPCLDGGQPPPPPPRPRLLSPPRRLPPPRGPCTYPPSGPSSRRTCGWMGCGAPGQWSLLVPWPCRPTACARPGPLPDGALLAPVPPCSQPTPCPPPPPPTCTCLCPRPALLRLRLSLGAPTVIPPLIPARVPQPCRASGSSHSEVPIAPHHHLPGAQPCLNGRSPPEHAPHLVPGSSLPISGPVSLAPLPA